MFARCAFSTCSIRPFRIGSDLPSLQRFRNYASHSRDDGDEVDFDAAREWYKAFNKATIPVKISTTSYSRSSGPGGQKTNKTDSKATTTWPLHALLRHIPKVLHQELRASRYYVPSSDSITIQCDVDRNQSRNREVTYQRLADEITAMYKKLVPGVTPLEQKKRVESLIALDRMVRNKRLRSVDILKLRQRIKNEKKKSETRRTREKIAERAAESDAPTANIHKANKKGKSRKN